MVHSTSQPEATGVIHGRYTIQTTLGVRLGRRTLLGYDQVAQRPVIIKYLCLDDQIQPSDIQRFEREIRVIKRLEHPAIPAYIDSFKIDNANYRGLMLVQSYVEGQSFYQLLQTGQHFTEFDLKQITQQLLGILTYLHQQTPEIIHRDLKPTNLVLANRSAHSVGTVYLVDFGLVQDTATSAKSAKTMMIVGTEGYMPPEQLGDRSTPASDLYCLGTTLIHLATKVHPSDLPRRRLRILFAQEMGHVSRPFKRWLRWMTEPRPEKRPQSAVEAKRVLDKADQIFGGRLDAATLYASISHRIKQQRTLFEAIKPEGSHLKLVERPNAIEIVIPSSGFKLSDRSLRNYLRQIFCGLMGLGSISLGLTEIIHLALEVLALPFGGVIVAIATILSLVLVAVSSVILWRGCVGLLNRCQRKTRIQLESDSLLVGHESPLQSLRYVVNARRQDIFDIDLRPDGSSLYLFLMQNRTLSGQLNYRLSAHDLSLNLPEMHWLNDMLHVWLKRARKAA